MSWIRCKTPKEWLCYKCTDCGYIYDIPDWDKCSILDSVYKISLPKICPQCNNEVLTVDDVSCRTNYEFIVNSSIDQLTDLFCNYVETEYRNNFIDSPYFRLYDLQCGMYSETDFYESVSKWLNMLCVFVNKKEMYNKW